MDFHGLVIPDDKDEESCTRNKDENKKDGQKTWDLKSLDPVCSIRYQQYCSLFKSHRILELKENCNISISPGIPTASPFYKGGLRPPARSAYGSERGFFLI
jgi:hypothetical protein